MEAFTLVSDFEPAGDQPQAIDELARGIDQELPHQTLLGVTGSGKTYTMASVVAEVQKPTLILAPNKTLAAQLYGEFSRLFPHNAVEYFVSYYDYYLPEAYVPRTDTYIEKDAAINEHIDKMRHATTRSLLERRDVIVVASVVVHLRHRLAGRLRRHAGAVPERDGGVARRHPAPPGRHPVRPQ